MIFSNDAEKISTYDPRRKEDTLGEFIVFVPIAEGGHYRAFLGGVWSLARHARTKKGKGKNKGKGKGKDKDKIEKISMAPVQERHTKTRTHH